MPFNPRKAPSPAPLWMFIRVGGVWVAALILGGGFLPPLMGAYCVPCGRCARAVHKVCTGPYPSCIVVPSTSNNEPCYAFI